MKPPRLPDDKLERITELIRRRITASEILIENYRMSVAYKNATSSIAFERGVISALRALQKELQ